MWCWGRLLRVPWTTRRSNQSILKEISPEYSLEGLMRGGFLVSGCLTLSSEACISLYTFIQTKKELQNDYERIIWKWLDLGFMTEMVMISVQFSHSVMSDSGTPWTAAHQASCPSPTPRACSNSCPLSQWCHATISSSVVPFSSCLQSFPASGSFPMSQLFTSGGPSIGVSASASVLPMNIQDWFPLGWSDLISLQSKALSRVFSNTTVQKHQFFGTQPSLWSNSHIHAWLLEKPCRIKPMIYPYCLIPRLLPLEQGIYVWNNPRKLR